MTRKDIVRNNLTKLNILDLVRSAKLRLKGELVRSELEVLGVSSELVTSKTGYGGERLWFMCPSCHRRSGVLYRSLSGLVTCRLCCKV